MTAPITRTLWDHQHESWQRGRQCFAAGARSVLIQKPTGTGKTRLVGAMTNASIAKQSLIDRARKNRVWFVVPKKELLWQASEEFKHWVPSHGKIGDGREEGNFQSHVCSSKTLINRLRDGKIKNIADLIIFDEAHVALDRQLEIKKICDPMTSFIGLTATPERLDGRPLSTMYDSAVMDEQMQWYVDHGYLKKPLVYGLPTDIYDGAKFTPTGDLTKNSAEQIAALQKARVKGGFIFGDSIDHYGDLSQGRTFLDFCQSVAEAEFKADEWRRKGFKVESIDGKMSNAKRKALINSISTGELIGLTARDLPTYGLDVPNISCILLNRKTASLALLYQMLGRASRYDKNWEEYHIHDFVGNCDDPAKGGHGHPLIPRQWNFDGKKKRKKPPEGAVELIAAVQKCHICYANITKRHLCKCGNVFDIGEKCNNCDRAEYETVDACIDCGALKEVKSRKPMKELDGYLVEIKPGEQLPITERLPENQREYQDRINSAISRYNAAWYPRPNEYFGGVIDEQAVRDLLDVAHELKWKNPPVAVYKKLVPHSDMMVNTPLLTAIMGIKEYDHRWITRQREFFEWGLLQRQKKQDRLDQEPPGWVA